MPGTPEPERRTLTRPLLWALSLCLLNPTGVPMARQRDSGALWRMAGVTSDSMLPHSHLPSTNLAVGPCPGSTREEAPSASSSSRGGGGAVQLCERDQGRAGSGVSPTPTSVRASAHSMGLWGGTQ